MPPPDEPPDADEQKLTPEDRELLDFYAQNPDAAGKWLDTDADFIRPANPDPDPAS